MKKIIKGMIIFLSIILISLIALLTYALIRGDNQILFFSSVQNRFTEYTLINTQTASLEDISDISITGYSSDVIFFHSDSDEIIIKEYVGSEAIQKPFVTTQKNGNTLTIQSNKKASRSFFIFGNNRRYFEIYLPVSYQASIDVHSESGDIISEIDFKLSETSFETQSGDIQLYTLNANQISLTTTSGDISANTLIGNKSISSKSGSIILENSEDNTQIATNSGDVTLNSMIGELGISTTSGYINVTNLDGNSNFSSTSGDIQISDARGKMKFSTESGYINMYDLKGSVSARTSSGDIHLEFSALNDNLDLQTSSGDISCTLPNEAAFHFTSVTKSGDIHTYFDHSLSYNKEGTNASGTIGEASDITIQVQTSSGDIRFAN